MTAGGAEAAKYRPVSLDALEEREIFPGFRGRMVHAERVTLAFWTIEERAALPAHAHAHEQVVTMLEGALELTVEGETRVLRAGDVLAIPGGATHSGRALEACRVLDVFAPVREDYRTAEAARP